MLKIVYNNGVETTAECSQPTNHIIKMVCEKPKANTTGFLVKRMSDNMLLGDYSDYITIYRKTDEYIEYSNDGSEWVEPEPAPVKTEAKVTFIADDKCNLVGETDIVVPVGTHADMIDYPNVEMIDETYDFIGWTPQIDVINDDITFTANTQLKEEYTLESRMNMAEECLMELAEIVYA